MKKKTNLTLSAIILAVVVLTVSTISCKKKSEATPAQTPSYFTQVNLTANTSGFVPTPSRIDTNIQDGWGIAVGPTGIIWVASNGPGESLVYDSSGNQKLAPVTIPPAAGGTVGAPSGVVYNSTTGFVVGGNPAKFIFVTEDGTISAWNSGTAASLVVDSSTNGAVYKGLTIASNGAANYLYVANFEQGRIDVFNSDFTYNTAMSGAFKDPNIPSGYAPFNIQYIGGQLYVVYAKLQPPPSIDDQSGPGNGYISVFTTSGTFVKRLVSNGMLNSPWAIVQAPSTFGTFANDLLVSNFGDGTISAYDLNGNFKGQLANTSGNIISINGLWGLQFPVGGQPAVNPNRLYFSAGPDDENDGLFGYLSIN